MHHPASSTFSALQLPGPPFPSMASRQTPNALEHAKLVKQTQKWVSQTFFGTLLKQVRHGPFHSDLFGGGQGGQAFGTMYDQHLADHMSRGVGSKLVKSIVDRIEARQAYERSMKKKGDAKAPVPHAPHNTRSGHVPADLRA